MTCTTENYITINNIKVPLEGETNILAVARKVNIEIPTFCYHSELSVYGACRLCLVDIEGMGIQTSCSTIPKPGMVVKTNTAEIREMRKTTVELLLANHKQTCPTCDRSADCKLRELSSRLGIQEVRYRKTKEDKPLDNFSDCLVRDPNKCVLCGDCVRFCDEIQGIAAIDFAHRGENVVVTPAFGKSLNQVDCINCGQCAAVCPTGAITPKSDIDKVWDLINNPNKKVVAQVAPAVRVAIGEMFGMKAGEITLGKIITALKMLGFDKVYDTSFAADLTVIEEATEFLQRKSKGEKLPIFTSCCPGWVKYAEQSHPDLLENLSSCKSPQQMFGSVIKEELPREMNIPKEELAVVSIMPCTAKKFEVNREEFRDVNGNKEVDFVLTTQELGRMIKEAGIMFENIEPDSMDLPYGFTTGAGVIFGNSGGVSEAVLRYAYEKVTGKQPEQVDFCEVRGNEGIKEANINLNGTTIKMAIVHGIKNAKTIADAVKNGTADYDIVEVMACPGGCIGGAGQPIAHNKKIRDDRTKGIYIADKRLQLHKSQENPFITELYRRTLGEPGSHKSHELLHTTYKTRKRIESDSIELIKGINKEPVQVKVCVGTGCYLRGSQDLLTNLIHKVEAEGIMDYVDIKATFCKENCDKGPTVKIGDERFSKATLESVYNKVKEKVETLKA